MASHYQIGARCYTCSFCNDNDMIANTTLRHPLNFKPATISHIDGIDFEFGRFTASQITDAFLGYIHGYTDWPIKQRALDRWSDLSSKVMANPRQFDLKTSFGILDDFLFLGALQSLCDAMWVDEPTDKDYINLAGWCEPNSNIRGPRIRICLVRNPVDTMDDVHRTLCILMHEMCHALFAFTCTCAVCECILNRMHAEGISWHGPDFQKIRLAVEETVRKHLHWQGKPFELADETNHEEKDKVKVLGGLIEKIKRQDLMATREKKDERMRKRLEDEENTPEADSRKPEREETLEYMVSMFNDAKLT